MHKGLLLGEGLMNVLCMTSFGQGRIDFNINAANTEETVEFGLEWRFSI